MLSANEIKQKTGMQAAAQVPNNMIVGIGTGSTAYWFITALSKRIKEGLKCKGVPTSQQTKLLAAELNIPLVELNDIDTVDITIDGADEIDTQLQLIKGGGGALLQEKMVAAASKQLIIVADNSKLVEQLGVFPLPVEVIPYGWKQVQYQIQLLYQIKVKLRYSHEQPFVTDHNHYILDCYFQHIPEPFALSIALNNIPGVVENGLFINMAHSVIIGYPDGKVKTLYRN